MEIIDLKAFSQDDAVEKAVAVLQAGGLVIYPTDTVYGVAVDATNQTAVEKLLRYKGRQFTNPIPIAVDSMEMAEKYVELNIQARNLYQNFLPGPLTVVSKSKHQVCSLLEPPTGTLGVRMIEGELVEKIISRLGKPVTTTSAVGSGKRAYTVESIMLEIAQSSKLEVDLVLDAGALPKAAPSAVVDTTYDQQVVLRPGVLELTEVDSVVTHNASETVELGRKILEKYLPYLEFKSVVFALSGDLGAGKTHFTKGVAAALAVTDEILSPTFTIEREYAIDKGQSLYHLDVWRMQDVQELEVLELERKVQQGNVFVIEWAERIETWFETIVDDAVIVWVEFRYGEIEQDRLITVKIHR